MPKATLDFDLDDHYDREQFKYAHTGFDVRLAVMDFDEHLRHIAKHTDDHTLDVHWVREFLWKCFEERDVDFEVG